MNTALALFGGEPIITKTFPAYKSIGREEEAAVAEVMRSGLLSGYVGARGDAFMGGPRVRALEAAYADYFGMRHAIAVNSWTSGLIAAVGAIGLEPGDEVIVTPWTMAATATAILHWNGIPVFADIDPDSFNLDPVAVARAVTPHTRAIMVADIFGQSADMPALRSVADRHGLKIISDTAQSPGAIVDGRPVGTLADVGGFSLNFHKHVHCGEGGVVVTDDDAIAVRVQLIRNHAEAVIDSDDPRLLANMLGFNFRMGEIEAAIAVEQLKKLREKVASRQRAAMQLSQGIGGLAGLQVPLVREGCTHVYYVYGIKVDPDVIGISRARLVEALRAEGVPGLMAGYQNIHRLPLFRHRIAYGTQGFPWRSEVCRREVPYGEGVCPIAEDLHERTFIGLNLCAHDFDRGQVDAVITAFQKVWSGLAQLSSR